MKRLLFVAVSALALAQGARLAAAEGSPPLADRFSTDIVIAPGLVVNVPTSPAYALGVGRIGDDAVSIDPITTGKIANGDAEAAAGAIKAAQASQPSPDDAHAAPDAGGHGAPDAGHAAPAEEHSPGEEASGEGSAQWATVREPMPFDIIRTIQFLQDQVSRGNGRAIQVQASLLRRFGPVFVRADPKVWEDARNRRAAVLFVMSGGPPAVLKRLMADGVVGSADEPLFAGALAYVESDLDKAETLLSSVDFEGMEPGLEAHVNLVLGQLRQLSKPKEAAAHLDRARLLAPGGLIEEAALRMEMLIVDELGDHAMADRLARQYFDRFAQSSYAANFEARFASVYASRGRADALAARDEMLDVTARLADANRRTIFLGVGRRALVEGNLAFAGLAAQAALATEGISAAEIERAKLYALAARLSALSSTAAEAELAAIDRDGLHPEDVKLYDAATSIHAGIGRIPRLADSAAGEDPSAETSPVFGRAQQLLSEVAGDLGEVQP